MKLTWRLSCNSVIVYYPFSMPGVIYLAEDGGISDKVTKINVSRDIDSAYDKKVVPSLEIKEVKFDSWDDGSTAIAIKSDQLSKPGEFYKIGNFDVKTIGNILTYSMCDEGIVTLKDDKQRFEIAYNNYNPEITLVHEGMPGYKAAINELGRLTCCKAYKKTKKWIPGHSYATEKENYIYLGEFENRIRRKKGKDSGDYDDIEKSIPVRLVIYETRGEKTITDVFNNRSFNCNDWDGIKIIENTITAVDCGEVLEDDYTGKGIDFSDFYEPILEKTLKESLRMSVFQRPYYVNYINVLDVISTQSIGGKDYSKTISPAVKKLLENSINTLVWNGFCESVCTPGITADKVDYSSFVSKAMYHYLGVIIEDSKVYKRNCPVKVLSKVGIDVNKVFIDNNTRWKELNDTVLAPENVGEDDNFEQYTKIIPDRQYSYDKQYEIGGTKFDFHSFSIPVFNSDSLISKPISPMSLSRGAYSVNYLYKEKISNLGDERIKASDVTSITSVLKDLCEHALKTDGDSVSKFGTATVSRSVKKFIYITLLDLLNFAKREKLLTTNLKQEIVGVRFRSLLVKNIDDTIN